MTTDDAPRSVLLAAHPNAKLWYVPHGERYLWETFDGDGQTVILRFIDAGEAAVLHALLPTKVREMP